MFGQGRPRCRGRPHGRSRLMIRFRSALTLLALTSCASVASRPALAAELMDVRIRIAWGGGEARPWQGTIRISEGTLSDVTPLGLEPDAPGSLLLTDPTTIHVCGR